MNLQVEALTDLFGKADNRKVFLKEAAACLQHIKKVSNFYTKSLKNS